jgi:CubicO group peptidase (beta-lactamase class C family)
VGLIPLTANDYWINYDDKSATASCKLLNPRNATYKSIWRKNIGCTLVEELSEAEIRAQNLGNLEPEAPLDPNLPWPFGEGFFPERTPSGVDIGCLEALADEQFSEEIPNPRAMVVIYKGELVFERYAEGVTKENRLIGWSATKSLTGSLAGIATRGDLNIFKPAPVPEWYETAGDARQNITVDMMLRMSSGTRWVGDIGPTTECIFWSDNDCAHICGLKPLETSPDTEWNYNSGSSYLLSQIALDTRAEKEFTPWEWPKKVLFHPIGAHSMYIEHQPNGMYLGGAYGYGTPRDWARFGLLHLRDGVWVDGKRVLPEGWSQYARTSTHTNPNYAAHFWKEPSVDDKV